MFSKHFEDEKVSKISIIMDERVKSFQGLFFDCKCIESIKFIVFNNKLVKPCIENKYATIILISFSFFVGFIKL